MDPKQIGGAGLGLSAGGSLLSAGSAVASGFASKSAYDYQAAVAKLKSQIAAQNAEFAIQTGEQQATKTGLAQGARMGQIKVAQAAGGFDVNSGSNVQVRESQKSLDAMDLNQIRSNAARTAYGYKIEGATDDSQAEVYKAAGDNAVVGGVIQGFGSILGGAGSVSSQWLQGQRVGLWGGSGNNDSAYGISNSYNYGN
jgi:hypothetical protein